MSEDSDETLADDPSKADAPAADVDDVADAPNAEDAAAAPAVDTKAEASKATDGSAKGRTR